MDEGDGDGDGDPSPPNNRRDEQRRERYRALWRKTIDRTILTNLQVRLRKADTLELQTFLQWRVANNLYRSGQYDRAMPMLEDVAAGGPYGRAQAGFGDTTEAYVHPVFDVHLCAARCAMQLNALHEGYAEKTYYIEAAHRHYAHAIEKMNLFVCIARLPGVLHEFGIMLEQYCSYDNALELYKRVLVQFPYYRRYFEVLYRTVVLGKHLSVAMTSNTDRDDVLHQCAENVSLILEAVPVAINDIHAMFLYARCLECLVDPKHAGRSESAYQALHAACLDTGVYDVIEDGDAHDAFETWFYRLETWLRFGDLFARDGELVLAKEAYLVFEARLAEKLDVAEDVEVYQDITVIAYMCMSRVQLLTKVPNEALRYAELAFETNHYDHGARALLASYSDERREWMEHEDRVFKRFAALWRQRFMTGPYLRKIKQKVLEELEAKLALNRGDRKVRKLLAYYDREKYRARFVFEHTCARRIQRAFRTRRVLKYFTNALVKHYESIATAVFKRFYRQPYENDVRTDVRRVAASKFCPKRHRIHRAVEALGRQDAAVRKIRKLSKAYSLCSVIARRIERRRAIAQAMLYKAAMMIQCVVRRRQARKVAVTMKVEFDQRKHAATVIQRFIRNRNNTFKYSVWRLVGFLHRDRQWAWGVLRFAFRYNMMRYVAWRRADKEEQVRLRALAEEEARRAAHERHINACASTVSRFVRYVVARRLRVLARSVRAARSRAPVSRLCRDYAPPSASRFASFAMNNLDADLLREISQAAAAAAAAVAGHPAATERSAASGASGASGASAADVAYRPPGLKQNTPQFARALEQQVVVCGPDFDAADCMMFAGVLRHPSTRTRELVFRNVDAGSNASFEFDLLPALVRCRSIRTVRVIGGTYTEGFFRGLMHAVKMDNPRITEVYIESLAGPCGKRLAADLALWSGRIICDYFNYSLPGLRVLSLHGCHIKDSHVAEMATGLGVSSCLTDLCLSNNLITDEGLGALLRGITGNKHRCLRTLDVSRNLLRCASTVHDAFRDYEVTCSPEVTTYALKTHVCVLEVFALHNMVTLPFRAAGLNVINVHFSAADVKEAARQRAIAAGIIKDHDGTATTAATSPPKQVKQGSGYAYANASRARAAGAGTLSPARLPLPKPGTKHMH